MKAARIIGSPARRVLTPPRTNTLPWNLPRSPMDSSRRTEPFANMLLRCDTASRKFSLPRPLRLRTQARKDAATTCVFRGGLIDYKSSCCLLGAYHGPNCDCVESRRFARLKVRGGAWERQISQPVELVTVRPRRCRASGWPELKVKRSWVPATWRHRQVVSRRQEPRSQVRATAELRGERVWARTKRSMILNSATEPLWDEQ